MPKNKITVSKKEKAEIQAKQAEATEEFDNSFDEKEYNDLFRRDPGLARSLERMIKAGIKPEVVQEDVVKKWPHRWPESQAILAAARYLERTED